MGRALDGVDADAADPHHDDRVTRLGLGSVHRRAPPGADAATDQRRLVEWDVLVQLHARRHVDHGVLAERRDARCLADRPAVDAETEAAVGPAPGEDVGAHVAQVLHARRAPPAPTTAGQERHDDVIADLPARRVRPDLGHDGRALVPAGHREDARRQVTRAHVVVGVTEARCRHPHHQLTLAGFVEVDVEDLPLPRRLRHHRTTSPHVQPPPRVLRPAPGNRDRGSTTDGACGARPPLGRAGIRWRGSSASAARPTSRVGRVAPVSGLLSIVAAPLGEGVSPWGDHVQELPAAHGRVVRVRPDRRRVRRQRRRR